MAHVLFRPSEVSTMDATIAEYKLVNVFYKTVELTFCLDFGFFKHKSTTHRIIWKAFTIFRAICFLTAIIALYDYGKDGYTSILWAIFQLSSYFLTVIVLVLFNPNRTFCQLHHDLELIDRKFLLDVTVYNLEKKILFWNVFIVISNIVEKYIFCSYHTRTCSHMSWITSMIYFSCLSSLSVVYVSKSFLFYCLTCRLNVLFSMLKSKNVDINSMKRCYKHIVEVAESYKAAFDPLFCLAIVFKTLEYMAYFFNIVMDIIEQRIELQYFVLLTVSGTISFFAPALFAELTASKQEKIKIVLQDKLLDEEDESRQRQLKQFLWYVESRGLRFRVYKLIPLDANLFTAVLKFIVTYVIVIVQFIYK